MPTNNKQEKWIWMMKYCRQRGIPPAQKWAWDQAKREFNIERTKMGTLGMFSTVARTELKLKDKDVSDETLTYLNYAIKQAYSLGINRAAEIAESGSFLHDESPEAKFGRQAAQAIRRDIEFL